MEVGGGGLFGCKLWVDIFGLFTYAPELRPKIKKKKKEMEKTTVCVCVCA